MVRTTRQRLAIADALNSAEGFRNAQEIHDLLRKRGVAVGLTTVYRALQALVDAGEVDVLRSDEGEAIYRRCESSGHHHHLVCRGCGTSFEIDNPEVERWADEVARERGFSEVSHTVEIYGLCPACS